MVVGTPGPGVAQVAARAGAPPLDPVRVLLIEDDEGDAFLVRELLEEVGAPVSVGWARSLREAEPKLPGTDCVLLDLGLPDASGLDGLRWVLDRTAGVAVLVLTGFADEQRGIDAMGAGAQDYLIKGQVDGALLVRVIRYAIERRRADEVQRLLGEERLLGQEKVRLERGLLPTPVVPDPGVTVTTRYEAGQDRMLLGGDFFDAVQAPDGTVHVAIGDVSGHGPDEAALGVCLRVAWRTMVMAERPVEEQLRTMQRVLVHERHEVGMFATMCVLSVAPDRRSCRLYLAGHPPPLLLSGGRSRLLTAPIGLPLGVLSSATWTAADVALEPPWSLLLYTDGLIEGRIGDGPERLGGERLRELLDGCVVTPRPADPELLDVLVQRVEELNGGALLDDLAVLLLTCRQGPAGG